MLRVLLAIILIILSALGSYYVLVYSPENTSVQRPEISDTKKAVIAKRAERKALEQQIETEDQNAAQDLDRNVK